MQETRVQSGSREDSLEKETAIHSSILAWKIRWLEKPGRPRYRKESDTIEQLTHTQPTTLKYIIFQDQL